MTDEKTEVTAPTVVDLEAKVGKLGNQLTIDAKAVEEATASFKQVMKSGDVDKALESADARTKAIAAFAKTTSQLKTAKNAITSANYAASAEKIASIHEAMRGSGDIRGAFQKLTELGVTKVTLEKSEETGKLIINSTGPAVKRTRAAGGGTGSRGQTLTVDGEEYASASAACRAFYPDSGPLNRESIISKLTNAGHEVA